MSHTQRMENLENKTKQNETLTKANFALTLSSSDAEEYRAYKRQKKIAEITSAISRSASSIGMGDDVKRITERAVRLRQASVRLAPSKFYEKREVFSKYSMKVDCIIGGDGELLPKVKAYEAVLARRMGAKELTVKIAPSMISTCRYTEIKRELKKIKKAAGKTICFKVWMDKKYPYASVLKIARICSEVGVQYFSIPYFSGCERLRFDLTGGCALEVSEVETLADFKKMQGAGVGRIVTSHIWEIYSEWMREVDKIGIVLEDKKMQNAAKAEEKQPDKPAQTPKIEQKAENAAMEKPKNALVKAYNPETDYACRLENGRLKFL